MSPTGAHAAQVFGLASAEQDLRVAASMSRVQFVRSQDELALWSPKATGRVLSAREAFSAFGFETLAEAVENGSAILPCSRAEPAATLRKQREALGLSVSEVAKSAGLDVSAIERAEEVREISPIRTLERIARILGLDERLLAVKAGAGGDPELAYRLREMRSGSVRFSASVVSALAEAAWVVSTQRRLESDLAQGAPQIWRQEPSNNYEYPTWRRGYELAARTRRALGLDAALPISNLRELCERLGVPIVQLALPANFAGATVASGSARGIVVNTEGANRSVWVRRATIAHELGHLLWDPRPKLHALRVDEYVEIDTLPWAMADRVEARANAFAIEFLAPQTAALAVYREHADPGSGVAAVMERFGISATAARNHLGNALGDVNALPVASDHAQPSPDWEGRESFTTDYFPSPSTPLSRRGSFAGVVVAAEGARVASEDTAAEYLNVTIAEYRRVRGAIAGLFSAT